MKAVVQKLEGMFGAEVVGLDLGEATNAQTTRWLAGLLFEHGLVVIPKQKISAAEYLAFGRQWGRPIDFFRATSKHPVHPELIVVSNSPDKPPEQKNNAAHWHTDGSYEVVRPTMTMLYALEAPLEGGETGFANLAAAYAALPAERHRALEGLEVVHFQGGGAVRTDGEQHETGDLAKKEEVFRQAVVHPLVVRHPVTGRPSLYAISGTANRIVGKDIAAGRELLQELKMHALQTQFRQRYKAEVGDIVIWDNLATLHSAAPIEHSHEDGKRRLLLRFSTRDVPAFQDSASS